MEPVYIDIHIHTSEDPDNLNPNYDLDLLISKINEFTSNSKFLISITDHNNVNKAIYLNAVQKGINIVLGVELHIKNYDECPAYHCHIYFNLAEINDIIIDDINNKLNELYPSKKVNKDDASIPKIEKIINTFDEYEFILLPHGGQSHATFDTSIPSGVKFDGTMQRSIYYNQFDGFTARGNKGLERTQEYFKKLGINEFVNLVTCTDNYDPNKYPSSKAKDAGPFVPTWMFALPTFNGLRLSLSESSRLVYDDHKPTMWSENITAVTHKRANIEIEVELTSGLNVVIGGSSSGKTLLVDSIYNKIVNDFSESPYMIYEVDQINVENPSGVTPHFLSQNYIMSVVNSTSDNKIEDIEIVKKVFPGDEEIRDKIEAALKKLKQHIRDLIKHVKVIEEETNNLSRIPHLSKLILKGEVQINLFNNLIPSTKEVLPIELTKQKHIEFIEDLESIDQFLNDNPLIEHNKSLIDGLKLELDLALKSSLFELKIRKIIKSEKELFDSELKSANVAEQSKQQNFISLIESVKKYVESKRKFHQILSEIAKYSVKFDSEKIESMGHTLYIENNFELSKEKFIEVINKFLKSGKKIDPANFNSILPESFFQDNFSGQKPKVKDYDDFEAKVYKEFEAFNNKQYKIIDKEGRNFENLSAGWKTSILLDLILGYDKDVAPVIIDQPEDNLATNYINSGLVEAIKKIKKKKQVILVSHNATIPMLADAQNVVLCRNESNKLVIKSNRLEGSIDGTNVLDFIADITDGGKPSIKKRVKKYNLKNFQE
ncbi:MAG TPA: ATPase [Bacteroidia bacterium]|nr:ATPase [Bacteroidia bacterium]